MSLRQLPLRPSSLAAPFLALGCFAAILGSAITAGAAEWVEQRFDPPAGSRWILRTNETTEEERGGKMQTTVIATTAELTFEEKTSDGFRVSYVVRKTSYDGDARAGALVAPLSKALENFVIHATTAANGMPLRIDNLAELQAAARAAIDRSTAALGDKPEADTLRQLAANMLVGDAKRAPKVYLGSLAKLALGQDTGLHPGETRSEVDEAPNPLSGIAIKSNTTLRIDTVDPETGNVRFIRTSAFDSEAIKDFLNKMVQQMIGENAPKLESLMKLFSMALDSRMELDVESGMTRAVHQEDIASASVLGQKIVRRSHKQLTVAPAP